MTACREPVKRPLAIAGMCFAAVTVCAFYISLAVSAAVCAVSAAVFAITYFGSKKGKTGKDVMTAAFLAVIFCVVSFLVCALSIHGADVYLARVGGEETLYRVRVTEVEDAGGSVRVTGDIREASGEKVRGISALFYLYEQQPAAGDEIICRLSLYPDGYDAGGGLRFNSAVKDLIEIREQAYAVTGFFNRIKTSIRDIFFRVMPEDEASVAAAMVTGLRTDMSARLNGTLQRAGVSHIVVVSGLHITILFGALNLLIKRMANPWVKSALCAAFITAVMLFYGFSPSVIRACVMGSFVFFGGLFYFSYDGLTSLMTAATLILLFTPAAIKSISFQLSFACCLAIVGVYAPLRKRMKFINKTRRRGGYARRILIKLLEAAALSAVISLITLPVTILNGMPFSLASPLANPVIVMLVPAAMVLCIITAAIGFWIPVSAVSGYLAALVIRTILMISGFFSGFRLAAVDTRLMYLKEWAILAVIAFGIFLIFTGKRRLWIPVTAAAISLAAVITLNVVIRRNAVEVLLYRGEALVIRDGSLSEVILGGVSENELNSLGSYLLTRGITSPGRIIKLDRCRLDENIINEVFYDSELWVYGDAGLPAYHDIASAWVEFDEARVIINAAGRKVAVSDGRINNKADVVLLWRGAAEYIPDKNEYAVIYEQTNVNDSFSGLIYGYRDIVEVIIKNGGFKVNLR